MGAAVNQKKLSHNDSQSKLSSPVQEGAQQCVEPEPHYNILFLERLRREPSRLVQKLYEPTPRKDSYRDRWRMAN